MAVVTRRLKGMASIGLVAALGIAASVGLASSAAAKPRPVRATVVTAPVTTASFTFSATVSGIAKGVGAITVTGTGQVDLVNDAVSLSVTLPGSVAGLIPGGSAESEVITIVFSGGTIYAEVPSLATLLGAPWISVALPSTATTGIPGTFTEVAGALGDVNEILAFAHSHHAKVHSLGSSTVDNTSVTGSRITAHVKGLNVAATLWADSSNRLVQASVSAKTHRSVGISAIVNLSGYGAPVTITVPPSSQVKAIPLSVVTSVLGGLLQHAHVARHGANRI